MTCSITMTESGMLRFILIAISLMISACDQPGEDTRDLLVGDGRKAWLHGFDTAFKPRDSGIVSDVFYRFDRSGKLKVVLRPGDGVLDSVHDHGDLVVDYSWRARGDSILQVYGYEYRIAHIDDGQIVMRYEVKDWADSSVRKVYHDTLTAVATYLDGQGCRWNVAPIGRILTSNGNRWWSLHSSSASRQAYRARYSFDTLCGLKVIVGVPDKYSKYKAGDTISGRWYVVSDSLVRITNMTSTVMSMSAKRIVLRYSGYGAAEPDVYYDTLLAE